METLVFEKKVGKKTYHKIVTGKSLITRVNGKTQSAENYPVNKKDKVKMRNLFRDLNNSGYRITELKVDDTGIVYEQIKLF